MADLKQGRYAPIYFLYGEEPYFIDVISKYIETHALSEEQRGFNQSVYYGKDIDAQSLLAAARRYPMMADKQVIVLKEAQHFKQFDQLLPYLEQPVESTILVFCHKNKSPDKRTKFGKTIQQHLAFESRKLYDNEVPGWIQKYLKEKKVETTPRGLAMLSEYLGSDIARIVNELDKLLLNMEGESQLTEKAITQGIGISREYNVFELQDAIAQRDMGKCVRIVQYFSNSKNSMNKPVVVLGTLFGWFSKLLLVHYASTKDERSLASSLGINPFFVKDYLRQASKFHPMNLERIIGVILEMDLRSKGIKGSSIDDTALYKELIVKIFEGKSTLSQ